MNHSNPIRVLSVQHYPQFGGPHNEVLRLEPSLNELGVKTVVAITDFPGTAYERLKDAVEIHRIELQRFRDPRKIKPNFDNLRWFRRDVRTLRSLIRSTDADVVKIHGAHNPQGAIAAILEHRALVWVLSSDRPPRIFRKLGSTYVNRYADSLLVTGSRMLSAYSINDELRERAVSYFPPVDTEKFSPKPKGDRDDIRERLGLSSQGPLIGTISNINPQKGLEFFVRAAGLIRNQVPDAQFVVVGGVNAAQESYFCELKREVAELGFDSGQFTFLGAREDVWEILPAFDIKVISSRAEGMPTTAGEAMACGVPVIATDVGSLREVVKNSQTGYIVEPEDPDSIALAVGQVLKLPDGGESMRANARQLAVAEFATANCARSHLLAYETALARARLK